VTDPVLENQVLPNILEMYQPVRGRQMSFKEAVRAAVSSFLQQEGELYLLVWDNNNNDNTNNNNNDNLQQGGSGLFLSVLKQALLLVVV